MMFWTLIVHCLQIHINELGGYKLKFGASYTDIAGAPEPTGFFKKLKQILTFWMTLMMQACW